MNVHILEEAAEDVTAIHDWYETKRPGLGADFELCIEEIFNRISSMPETYPGWYRKTRCALLMRFPYGIFYNIIDSVVYIIGIFHLKRKPARIKHGIRIRKI
jgi:toxin ParE1/3/4